jgi:hypothetical protein
MPDTNQTVLVLSLLKSMHPSKLLLTVALYAKRHFACTWMRKEQSHLPHQLGAKNEQRNNHNGLEG